MRLPGNHGSLRSGAKSTNKSTNIAQSSLGKLGDVLAYESRIVCPEKFSFVFIWAYFRNGPNAAASIAPTLKRAGYRYVSNSVYKTQANKQTEKETKGRTNARNRILCILALKCDIWWQYCNDFSDKQLTKFRVLIG